MMTKPRSLRLLGSLLCLGLFLGLCGPIDFTPSAEAATSAEKRKTRALKKDNRKLKKQNNKLKMDLAAALLPDPALPFIEMVTVGNPGNANDPEDGNINDIGTKQNFGAVPAAFQIGKYEVTNAQYAAFLNAVAAEDTTGLFNQGMEDDARGGIRRTGADGSYRYTAKSAMCDKPVNYVSFWDACRFCNWLHNGRATGVQDNSTTEDGAYTLTATAPANGTVNRNLAAKFFIPTEDQWYKAAYHDPRTAASDGPPGDDNYWLYPMQSDGPGFPTEGTVNAFGEITNDDGISPIANYFGGAFWDSDDNGVKELGGNVTTVGSGGAGSASFYGARDMAGKVFEFNETIILSSNRSDRGLRGGAWDDFPVNYLLSAERSFTPPVNNESSNIGFRIASP